MVVPHALRALRHAARAVAAGQGAGSCGGPAGAPAAGTCGGRVGAPAAGSYGGPAGAPGAGSCAGPARAPPCPPCGARAPPPCRPREPGPPRGLRVVCCPPRRTPLPPCAPARASITCDDVTPQSCGETTRQRRTKLATGGQDCVARRLQCARRSRQLDYEREVADRADAPPPPRDPPPAPYLMGAERELARATDGRLYALPRTCAPRPLCTAGGSPPPPRAITLEEPDHTCHLRDRHHLDPCAHQPRVFVEIDRDATATSRTAAPKRPGAQQDISWPPRRSGDVEAGTCSRSTRESGRRADDFGWCSKPLSPPNAPQRCRPLTIVERLQRHSPRSAPRGPTSSGERRLHTSIVSAAGSMQETLRSKEQLKEAGRGRVATKACAPHQREIRPASPAGNLELQVTPGTSKLRVHVFLDNIDEGSCNKPSETRSGCSTTRLNKSCGDVPVSCTTNGSWLSIKNIHKQLTGCPAPKMSASDGKCPNSRQTAPDPRRACPPPAMSRPCCPPPRPGPTTNKPPASPCKKPKQCSATSTILANIVPARPYL